MRRMATVVFRMAGQVCMAIKRIYVPEQLHDRFVTAFSAAANGLVIGDGLDPKTTMGPLHTAAALTRARDLLEEAEQRGAKLRTLGRMLDEQTFRQGHFMLPTVVTNIDDEARLVTEEQFCPAIPVLRYRQVEDALSRANATIFGLGGSVWSRSIEKATALAWRLQAGTVFVNPHGTNSVNRRAPYGGLKQSGTGRRAGIEGLREYTQLQTLTTLER